MGDTLWVLCDQCAHLYSTSRVTLYRTSYYAQGQALWLSDVLRFYLYTHSTHRHTAPWCTPDPTRPSDTRLLTNMYL